MLAVARLGAVHSVVFGGFSAESLRDRVLDSRRRAGPHPGRGPRGGRPVPLKATVDAALDRGRCPRRPARAGLPPHRRRHRLGPRARRAGGRTRSRRRLARHAAVACAAEDPLFILYTSGSTGKPKGLVHTCGGYLTWVTFTHAARCSTCARTTSTRASPTSAGSPATPTSSTARSQRRTTLMFESTRPVPRRRPLLGPRARHRPTIFYGAPTALRALAAAGDHFVTPTTARSMRVLGTVGEPINPAAWELVLPTSSAKAAAPSSTPGGRPRPAASSSPPSRPPPPPSPAPPRCRCPASTRCWSTTRRRRLRGPGEGRLCLEQPWPGQARTVWGDHDALRRHLLHHLPGLYFTGDGCRRDADGYYWITGRVDDVINVSGHRMGTAEFESALVTVEDGRGGRRRRLPARHQGPGRLRLRGAAARLQAAPTEASLNPPAGQVIGAHARVDRFQVVPGLPKTRSGKVMRRILRKIAEGVRWSHDVLHP
jgi:acetyl-CoA synthetase